MLDSILDDARERLAGLVPESDRWAAAAEASPPAHDFAAALRAPGLGVIAEIKRRSPSVGEIAPDLVPARLANAYAGGGAAAVSVLTESRHFGGSMDDLEEVRRAVSVPVLCKDFVLHEVQIDQSRAAGADAVLLIVAALEDDALRSLLDRAAAVGMTALVEAHDAGEVRRAVAAGAAVLGINNRDLSTFEVDVETALRLRSLIPEGVISVAESGVRDSDDARRLAAAGFDAILVGRAAAAASDPGAFVAGLQA